ncbi:type II toxin-antitoxin system VapC family toxin [Sediminispirochaeta smaragdinae]|jgi:hypothetical protein|uniref:PilT protein domain protein n=1 Tax=Sediminispirochaeta smaragdinae (strain DSM 11293 / JCM 15392 / SEBR 4228) TaxID=573413 RepID=E1RBQ2_SEDSS|nr:PIN domain nuclease [Sediminispirochaeta smaragdinae]ADK79782.1 PilT protein domain protein [Sediminispirochaeta smaragdinae DSM 11293]
MILVDTSVLIDYLKGADSGQALIFDKVIQHGIPYGINDVIYQEVLQGAKTMKEFGTLKGYLETLPFYGLQFGKESYERAALINLQCRRNGITVRSTIDVLIVETAIENNLFLLHNDADFDRISTLVKELKIFRQL